VVLLPLVNIALAFIVVGVIVAIIGVDPFYALRLLVTGANGIALAISPYTGKGLGKQTLPGRSHLPPVVIIHGDADPGVPIQQSELFIQRAREAGVKNLELISITLDPAGDTPGVLRDYAAARGIDTSNFSFLTGPEPAIRDLLKQFGIIAEFQGDLIKHTLATLLIDEQGRIIHRADGSEWQVREFVEKMHKG